MTEISDVVDKLSAKKAPDDICEIHSSPLSYFCATCSTMVCSDCAMFEPEHKGHKFEKVGNVYEKKAEELKTQGEILQGKIEVLRIVLGRIDANVEDLKRGKETVEADLKSKLHDLTYKLESELQSKVSILSQQKAAIMSKISSITATDMEVSSLLTAPKSRFIAAFPQLMNTVQTQALMPGVEFVGVSGEFESGVKPRYSASTFILHDYSRNKSVTEVIYSETLQVQREVWRLKVYPNGNGEVKGTFLSVFLELIKGGYGSIRYDYRIELVNQKDPALRFIREFSSEFDPGECWGYNRFLQLDDLLPKGYLDPSEDRLIFRFYVRPSSFSDLCRSQKRYIQSLETENRELAQRQTDMRKKLEKNTLLESAENLVTSPQPQKSSERLSWRLGDCDLLPNEDLCRDGLLGQGYMISPEDVSYSSCESSGAGRNAVQGMGWVSGEEENDGDVGNEDVRRSTWLEKRFQGLMNSPRSES